MLVLLEALCVWQAFGSPTLLVEDKEGQEQMLFGSDRFHLIAQMLGKGRRTTFIYIYVERNQHRRSKAYIVIKEIILGSNLSKKNNSVCREVRRM